MQSSVFPQSMIPLAFVGNPQQLDMAYPLHLRGRVQELARVLATDVGPDDWRKHKDVLREAEVILATWYMPLMDAEFLQACPRLRAVFYAAGTVKGFVTPEVFERDIVVSSARLANAVPVAEYSTAVVLLSLKHFWLLSRKIQGVETWPCFPQVPGNYQSTVGIVSLGAAGRGTAEMLSRFDLNLLAYDPCVSPGEAKSLNVQLADLEEIFLKSDVVSIHAPWMPETENLVNAQLLRSLRYGATIINTSRGAIVNEDDLCQVLTERPDLTAILDVTNPEPPLPDSPLYRMANVIVTPHIAGSLGREITRMGSQMVDELGRYVRGQPLKYQVEESMLVNMA